MITRTSGSETNPRGNDHARDNEPLPLVHRFLNRGHDVLG